MDIKYPIENEYMKCVLHINGFSGPRSRVRSSLRVWGHDKTPIVSSAFVRMTTFAAPSREQNWKV